MKTKRKSKPKFKPHLTKLALFSSASGRWVSRKLAMVSELTAYLCPRLGKYVTGAALNTSFTAYGWYAERVVYRISSKEWIYACDQWNSNPSDEYILPGEDDWGTVVRLFSGLGESEVDRLLLEALIEQQSIQDTGECQLIAADKLRDLGRDEEADLVVGNLAWDVRKGKVILCP